MLSSALKYVSGSSVYRNYDVSSTSRLSAGPWRIFDAQRRGNATNGVTAQAGRAVEVSVFVFEKKSLEQHQPLNSRSPRVTYEHVYVALRKEVNLLSKLRHPGCLELVEPLEESRSSLIFVTERVVSTVQMVAARGEVDRVEAQMGLLQLTKALTFLHGSAGIVHSNLLPEVIFINSKNDWKLGGFRYGIVLAENSPSDFPEYNPRFPRNVQRNFDFSAPEYMLKSDIGPHNDMFSLGCLVVALYNKGKSPIQCEYNSHLYSKAVEKSSALSNYGQVPDFIKPVLSQLLSKLPEQRPSASAFELSSFFDNILMSTIRFLESFPEKTPTEKVAFLRGLSGVFKDFPKNTLQKKMLPLLLAELKDTSLISSVLPNVFLICKDLDEADFTTTVLPQLKPYMAVSEPSTAALIFLSNIDLMRRKTSAQDFKDRKSKFDYRNSNV